MATHPKWTRRFLGMTDFDAVSDAIKAAESHTSAEIRVHLERRLPRGFFGARVDALARARGLFTKLGMHRTEARHGRRSSAQSRGSAMSWPDTIRAGPATRTSSATR